MKQVNIKGRWYNCIARGSSIAGPLQNLLTIAMTRDYCFQKIPWGMERRHA